jgi:hypothetical protein
VARKEARFPSTIWGDSRFKSLDRDAQWLFLVILSQPEVTAAGILPLRLRRWAAKADGGDTVVAARSLASLTREGWLEVDEDTEEVYLPTFFEWERIGAQPRRVVAALDALGGCFSPRLRAYAAVDLTEQIESCTAPLPRGVRAEVLLRDGNRCRGCGWRPGDPVPQKNGRDLYRGLEVDHVYPKSAGGTDDLENLQVLCTSCNASKGATV